MLLKTVTRTALNLARIGGGFALLMVLAIGNPASAELRVSMSDAIRAAQNKPNPEYPAIAKQMKAAGKVEVEALITTDGKVEEVKIISGNPMLTRPAARAVKDWTFTPFQENGQPSKAVVLLTFDFKAQ